VVLAVSTAIPVEFVPAHVPAILPVGVARIVTANGVNMSEVFTAAAIYVLNLGKES
jgi:hypothetical protein